MKRREGVKWFALVLLLLVIGAAVLQSQVVHEYRERQARAQTNIGPESRTELAEPVTLKSPHAILVLDVSGSMRQSDPRHMQSAAVHEFFHVYRELSREIVGNESSAKIAVVLFSTVAQVVDWGDNAGPWLAATDENEVRFAKVIDGFLGNGAIDRRTGGNTDYLAALFEIRRLTDSLPSAPAVVFMTDGKYEPNPLFTPEYDLDRRRMHAPAQFDHYANTIKQVLEGGMRRLDVTGRTLPAIFSGTPGSSTVEFSPDELATRSEKVKEIRTELLGRRYDGLGTEWSVVFLNSAATPDEVGNARALLAGADPSSFADCTRPTDMVGAFIQSIARWFGLRERQLRAASFDAPPETEALAIHVSTDPAATGAQLVCDSSVTPLNGSEGEWAGVATRPRNCRIEIAGGTLRDVRLYFKPRFDWVLRYPRTVVLGTRPVDVPVELQLYSLKEHRAVDASRLAGLPEHLPLSLRYPSGRHELTFDVPRVHRVVNGEPVEYRADLRANDLPIEPTTLSVDLASMDGHRPLSGSLNISASVAPIFKDSSDRETAIHISGLPTYGQTVSAIIRRLHRE